MYLVSEFMYNMPSPVESGHFSILVDACDEIPEMRVRLGKVHIQLVDTLKYSEVKIHVCDMVAA